MKLQHIILLGICLLCSISVKPEQVVEYVTNIVDQNLEITTDKDLHITATNSALINSTISLKSEGAWLFFDNIRPQKVIEDYTDAIYIYEEELKPNKNARVSIYGNGTVIIPHDTLYTPLKIYTDINFQGDSAQYLINYHYKSAGLMVGLSIPIGDMDNRARSFKLKRGYMATLGNSPYGTEYSRVFIADKEDIIISQLQPELDRSISYIRVMPWDWPTKKGWAGGAPDQIQKVDATWFYSWSADKNSDYNYQYVPIRQTYHWPTFDEINNKTNVNHLLGYNEPDRPDQADMTVEQAISQWPQLISSGLRLGSPVPSNPGNGNGWLYRFLDECEKLNYRVDYVVVHAYWGGKSPQNWYNDLKNEYERCGRRPLWITEWNNGADWTTENWPSAPEAQKQKQLSELKKILEVLDTCSFVERYSIYDWVNTGKVDGQPNKEVIRAMIWEGELTPAGEYYRDNKSTFAYNSKNEVIPVWKPLNPTLNRVSLNNNGVNLEWSDPNGTLTAKYIIERQTGDADFEEIALIDDCYETTFVDTEYISEGGYVNYRVKSVVNGNEFISNSVHYYVSSGQTNLQYGFLEQGNSEWLTCKHNNSYSASPAVILGISSFANGSSKPFTYAVNQLDTISFLFRIAPWNYLSSAITEMESVPYLSLPEGKHKWGNIDAQVEVLENVNRVWKTITFPEPFETIPVVFPTLVTNRSQLPLTVRVRNVSTTGFEIALQKEEGESKTVARERVSYIALTPGSGTYGNKKIIVGRTEDDAVGGLYESYKITFNESFMKPALFASMQTVNDEVVTTLRQNRLRTDEAVIFKSRENSVSSAQSAIKKETVGWMVLETDVNTSSNINNNIIENNYRIYPNPAADKIFITSPSYSSCDISIYNSVGVKVIEEKSIKEVDVSMLTSGIYILKINEDTILRFVKQ